MAPANALLSTKVSVRLSCRCPVYLQADFRKRFRLPRGTKQNPSPSHDHLTETSPLISFATTFIMNTPLGRLFHSAPLERKGKDLAFISYNASYSRIEQLKARDR